MSVLEYGHQFHSVDSCKPLWHWDETQMILLNYYSEVRKSEFRPISTVPIHPW